MMSVYLDPREVLEHLHSLGYHNISGEQLKEFIKDLKKLIKYDQIKKQKHSPPSSPIKSKLNVPSVEPEHCQEINEGSCEEIVPDPVDQKQESRKTLCPCSQQIEECDNGNSSLESERCPCMKRQHHTCRVKENQRKENIPIRPQSSFIRPNIQKNTSSKCDPVARFHHYQNLWAQQKFPGEDPRSDLRWSIRHQMMGPQPQMTRSSSVEKIQRGRKQPDFILN